MSRKLLQQCLDFVNFCWRDLVLNEYAEDKRLILEKSLTEELAKPDFDRIPAGVLSAIHREGYMLVNTPWGYNMLKRDDIFVQQQQGDTQ